MHLQMLRKTHIGATCVSRMSFLIEMVQDWSQLKSSFEDAFLACKCFMPSAIMMFACHQRHGNNLHSHHTKVQWRRQHKMSISTDRTLHLTITSRTFWFLNSLCRWKLHSNKSKDRQLTGVSKWGFLCIRFNVLFILYNWNNDSLHFDCTL